MEMFYLAGALATALAVVFSPKLSLHNLHKEMPEARHWTERYVFTLTSVALFFAALAWPIFWTAKLVRWLFGITRQ